MARALIRQCAGEGIKIIIENIVYHLHAICLLVTLTGHPAGRDNRELNAVCKAFVAYKSATSFSAAEDRGSAA